MAAADVQSRSIGFGNYFKAKIEELEIKARDKQQNLRRLEAQRNELNTKGLAVFYLLWLFIVHAFSIHFPLLHDLLISWIDAL